MRKTKLSIAFLLLAVFLFTLAGCSKEKDNTERPGTDKEETTTTNAADEITKIDTASDEASGNVEIRGPLFYN